MLTTFTVTTSPLQGLKLTGLTRAQNLLTSRNISG
jgi:hypothetical protein